MSSKQKTEAVIARVTPDIKREILKIANKRGESEAVILREALRLYLDATASAEAAKRSPAQSAKTYESVASEPAARAAENP